MTEVNDCSLTCLPAGRNKGSLEVKRVQDVDVYTIVTLR